MRTATGRRSTLRSLTLAGLTLAAIACQAGPTVTTPTVVAPSPATPAPPSSRPASPQSTTAGTRVAARELPQANVNLPAGRYADSDFVPRVTVEVEDLVWVSGEQADGLVTLLRSASPGSQESITLRFARPTSIHAGPDSITDATTATAAVETLVANPAVVHLVANESLMDGVAGSAIELDAAADGQTYGVMLTKAGSIEVAAGRRLWVAFFDTPEGLLAIVVEGSSAAWERDLGLVEPVLESVTIGR